MSREPRFTGCLDIPRRWTSGVAAGVGVEELELELDDDAWSLHIEPRADGGLTNTAATSDITTYQLLLPAASRHLPSAISHSHSTHSAHRLHLTPKNSRRNLSY